MPGDDVAPGFPFSFPFKLTSCVFALKATNDTDKTRVDCSDHHGAPGELLYDHAIEIWSIR